MDSQRPYTENGTQLDLLLVGHMQSPDRDDRYDQNHKISHNIDDARTDEYSVFVETIFSSCDFSAFADTFGGDREDQGEGVEKVPEEDEPNTS